MSLRPQTVPPVPEETARIARLAFPKGNLFLQIRDEIGVLLKAEREIKSPLPVPSVEQVSWWIVLESNKLKTDEEKFIESLSEVSDQFLELRSFSREFVKIIREKDENLFSDWLMRAQNSQVKEIKNFALGIRKDEEPVRQAVVSQWSNGQMEGQVNRLKTIKRQMYGRANFNLLRARVLYQN